METNRKGDEMAMCGVVLLNNLNFIQFFFWFLCLVFCTFVVCYYYWRRRRQHHRHQNWKFLVNA